MSNIDWSRPLEAVRKIDGKTMNVTLSETRSAMGHRCTNEIPDGYETNEVWDEDGSDICYKNLWFVRNKAEPKADIPECCRQTAISEIADSRERPANLEIPDWAIKRAHEVLDIGSAAGTVNNLARYIMTKEEPPVDPAIAIVRSIIEVATSESGWDGAGFDDAVNIYRNAIRELERGEVK